MSGPKAAFDQVQPYLATIAASGVSYVGEGELARICKIAHNVFLGVVIQNLAEITILAQKAGVPRHAFLDFMNASVLGSTFTKYKSNALVNLDWTTTFTPALLRKDLDLGLKAARDLDVAMPVTAATREALQSHFGAATLQAGSGRASGKGFRRAAGNRGARRRHQALARERADADRAGDRGLAHLPVRWLHPSRHGEDAAPPAITAKPCAGMRSWTLVVRSAGRAARLEPRGRRGGSSIWQKRED